MTNLSTATFIETFYAMLSSPPNRFTDYVAFNRQGGVVASGQVTSDDWTYSWLDSAMEVGQYDASLNEGVCISIAESQNYGWETFLIDRTFDNKVYFRLEEFEGQPEEGDVCIFRMQTMFFDATGETWRETAQNLTTPEPGPLFILVTGIAGVVIKRRGRAPSGTK